MSSAASAIRLPPPKVIVCAVPLISKYAWTGLFSSASGNTIVAVER